jgi:Zn finger protein HypA/HybF involved in hydrogenase expression
MDDLLAAHRHTLNNRAELDVSSICGCCACMEIFEPTEIVAWTGLDISAFNNPNALNAETAICPKCGSESLIGSKAGYTINPNFLSRMNQAWFQKTVIRRASSKT